MYTQQLSNRQHVAVKLLKSGMELSWGLVGVRGKEKGEKQNKCF